MKYFIILELTWQKRIDIFGFVWFHFYNMVLWAKKLKKNEGIDENCINTFTTLNLGLIANVKELFC